MSSDFPENEPVRSSVIRREKLAVFATIGKAFRVFAAAPTLFLAYSVPGTVLTILQLSMSGVAGFQKFGLQTILWMAVSMVVGSLTHVATIHATAEIYRGVKPTFAATFRIGLQRYLPALGASLLFALATVVGYVFLIVPGLIVQCALSLAVPACVVESRGPVASIRRSAHLTSRSCWRVFWAETIMSAHFLRFPLLLVHVKGAILFHVVLSFFTIPLVTILCTLIYFELRRLKEGTDASEAMPGPGEVYAPA